MKNNKKDKTKRKNWIVGDTFALKVENTKTEYDGKYIILIKSEQRDGYKETPCRKFFRAKLTIDNKLPKSINEIENLEFIKTIFTPMNMRFFPLLANIPTDVLIKERSKVKVYPDEYGYLYTYTFTILFDRNADVSNMLYLGNYKIKTPETEFFPFNYVNAECIYYPYLIEQLIYYHMEYDLHKSSIYDKKESISVHNMANNFLNTTIHFNNKFYEERQKNNK